MTIPSLLGCVFAAWVTSAPAFNEVNVIRVESSPPCVMEAQVRDQVLILTRPEARVEIPLPPGPGWYQLIYDWGRNVATVILKARMIRGTPTGR